MHWSINTYTFEGPLSKECLKGRKSVQRAIDYWKSFYFRLYYLFEPGGSDSSDTPLEYIVWFAPIIYCMVYEQSRGWYCVMFRNPWRNRKQWKIPLSLLMQESTNSLTVMPLDLDPQGNNRKLDHIPRTKDERIRWEIKNMSKGVTVWQAPHWGSRHKYDLQVHEVFDLMEKNVRTRISPNGDTFTVARFRGIGNDDNVFERALVP